MVHHDSGTLSNNFSQRYFEIKGVSVTNAEGSPVDHKVACWTGWSQPNDFDMPTFTLADANNWLQPSETKSLYDMYSNGTVKRFSSMGTPSGSGRTNTFTSVDEYFCRIEIGTPPEFPNSTAELEKENQELRQEVNNLKEKLDPKTNCKNGVCTSQALLVYNNQSGAPATNG